MTNDKSRLNDLQKRIDLAVSKHGITRKELLRARAYNLGVLAAKRFAKIGYAYEQYAKALREASIAFSEFGARLREFL